MAARGVANYGLKTNCSAFGCMAKWVREAMIHLYRFALLWTKINCSASLIALWLNGYAKRHKTMD